MISTSRAVVHRTPVGPAVLAGTPAAAAGAALPSHLPVALGLCGLSALVVAALTCRPRHLIAALIIYLPFSGWLVGYLPASAAAAARYAPEAVAAICVLVTFAAAPARFAALRPLLIPAAAVGVTWSLGALARGTAASTAVVGFRAELRWVLLGALVAASARPLRDARCYARAVVLAACAEGLIVVLEYLGGRPVRGFFTPDFAIVIGGRVVSGSAVFRPDTVTGTFGDYNTLGAFLVIGWLVACAAGRGQLGVPRWLYAAIVAGLPLVVVISGSREAVVAAGIGGAIVAGRRLRLPVVRAALAAALVAVSLSSLFVTTTVLTAGTRASLTARWSAALNPASYSFSGGHNFRFELLAQEARLVAAHSPLVGYGTGVVVDPRLTDSAADPLTQIPAGVTALRFGYVYDSNWGILLIETGALGTLALVCLLVRIGTLGYRAKDTSWVALAVLALVPCFAALGFFQPVFQNSAGALVFWILTGLMLAQQRAPHGDHAR